MNQDISVNEQFRGKMKGRNVERGSRMKDRSEDECERIRCVRDSKCRSKDLFLQSA